MTLANRILKGLVSISCGVGLIMTVGCGAKNSDDASGASSSTNSNYHVYISSGYPAASGLGIVTKWNQSGTFEGITADFTVSPGYLPVGLLSDTSSGSQKILMVSLSATGRVDSINPDGTNWNLFFDSVAGLIAGTHHIAGTADGGYVISRTAGVERFTAARTRVGAAARYAVSGTCAATAITSTTVATVGGVEYVLSGNAVATPNNKINLYNGNSAVCVTGIQPVGPATTMWPVEMKYVSSESKLFVLYYPFTAATSNAQIWSFDVTGATINNGTLVFDDTSGEIAVISATPQNLSSALAFYNTGSEKFFMVGTSNNTVMKLNWDGTSLTKASTLPFIWGSAYVRAISDILVLNQ